MSRSCVWLQDVALYCDWYRKESWSMVKLWWSFHYWVCCVGSTVHVVCWMTCLVLDRCAFFVTPGSAQGIVKCGLGSGKVKAVYLYAYKTEDMQKYEVKLIMFHQISTGLFVLTVSRDLRVSCHKREEYMLQTHPIRIYWHTWSTFSGTWNQVKQNYCGDFLFFLVIHCPMIQWSQNAWFTVINMEIAFFFFYNALSVLSLLCNMATNLCCNRCWPFLIKTRR